VAPSGCVPGRLGSRLGSRAESLVASDSDSATASQPPHDRRRHRPRLALPHPRPRRRGRWHAPAPAAGVRPAGRVESGRGRDVGLRRRRSKDGGRLDIHCSNSKLRFLNPGLYPLKHFIVHGALATAHLQLAIGIRPIGRKAHPAVPLKGSPTGARLDRGAPIGRPGRVEQRGHCSPPTRGPTCGRSHVREPGGPAARLRPAAVPRTQPSTGQR
jgi:hypothetical protein